MCRQLLPNVIAEELARWREPNCAVKPDVRAWQSMLAAKWRQGLRKRALLHDSNGKTLTCDGFDGRQAVADKRQTPTHSRSIKRIKSHFRNRHPTG